MPPACLPPRSPRACSYLRRRRGRQWQGCDYKFLSLSLCGLTGSRLKLPPNLTTLPVARWRWAVDLTALDGGGYGGSGVLGLGCGGWALCTAAGAMPTVRCPPPLPATRPALARYSCARERGRTGWGAPAARPGVKLASLRPHRRSVRAGLPLAGLAAARVYGAAHAGGGPPCHALLPRLQRWRRLGLGCAQQPGPKKSTRYPNRYHFGLECNPDPNFGFSPSPSLCPSIGPDLGPSVCPGDRRSCGNRCLGSSRPRTGVGSVFINAHLKLINIAFPWTRRDI